MKYNWRDVVSEILIDGMLLRKINELPERIIWIFLGRASQGRERTCKGPEVESAWQVEEMQGGDMARTEGAGGETRWRRG